MCVFQGGRWLYKKLTTTIGSYFMKTHAKSSVSLKINRTSVMLYRNKYVKAANGLPGMTAQHYVASFSTRESVLPAKFDSALRELTEGDPARYMELCSRIDAKVLTPRRAQLVQLEAQRVKANAVAGLDRAIDCLQQFEAALALGQVTAGVDVRAKTTELTALVAALACAVDAGSPAAPTLGTRITAMLESIKIVRDMLAVAPTGQDLGLTQHQVSDWRMAYFAFSQARDHAGSHRKIAAKQNWATNEWADEAVLRGFADADKVERARAKALSATKVANRVGRLAE
jgi:hypothetical protein